MEEQKTFEDLLPYTNPDGRRHPVYYSVITKKDGKLVTTQLQIVNSLDQSLSYIAIDRLAKREVKLGATHWERIYKHLLNKEPPDDLKKRVYKYYRIRKLKARRASQNAGAIYAPFEDPEAA